MPDRHRAPRPAGPRARAACCPRSGAAPSRSRSTSTSTPTSPRPARSDDLADTVDYGALCAVGRVGRRRRAVRACSSAGRAPSPRPCSASTPASTAVTVAVRKLRPPVPQQLATSGVRITADRAAGPPMTRAFLGLGSNLGDRARATCATPSTRSPTWWRCRRVYETDPVGGPGAGPVPQPRRRARHRPRRRARCSACATGSRRRPSRVRDERWGPRTLDVDILWIDGRRRSTSPTCRCPHPRMGERRFVLAPLRRPRPRPRRPPRTSSWPTAEGEVRAVGHAGTGAVIERARRSVPGGPAASLAAALWPRRAGTVDGRRSAGAATIAVGAPRTSTSLVIATPDAAVAEVAAAIEPERRRASSPTSPGRSASTCSAAHAAPRRASTRWCRCPIPSVGAERLRRRLVRRVAGRPARRRASWPRSAGASVDGRRRRPGRATTPPP